MSLGLAADTDIILMDEAFSGLDPLIRAEMQDQLLELQKTLHKTIVFITTTSMRPCASATASRSSRTAA